MESESLELLVELRLLMEDVAVVDVGADYVLVARLERRLRGGHHLYYYIRIKYRRTNYRSLQADHRQGHTALGLVPDQVLVRQEQQDRVPQVILVVKLHVTHPRSQGKVQHTGQLCPAGLQV